LGTLKSDIFSVFVDVYETLREISHRRFESFDLSFENQRLTEKIIVLESVLDQLSDRESTLENRVEYWRNMYVSQCSKYRKLQRVHSLCPKHSIILYR